MSRLMGTAELTSPTSEETVGYANRIECLAGDEVDKLLGRC